MKQRTASRNQKGRLPLYLTQFGFVPVTSTNQPRHFGEGEYTEGRTGIRKATSHKSRDPAKVDAVHRDKLVLQGYSTGQSSYGDWRPTAFGQTLNEFTRGPARRPPTKQSKPKGLIYDDYSDGEISLIIDEDLRRSLDSKPTKDNEKKKKAAAREIFGEADSNSIEGYRRDEKKEFRIKKDSKSYQAKPQPSTTVNPIADLVNLTGGLNRTKFAELENNFWRNKLDSRTDINLKDIHYRNKESAVESIKDISLTEKMKKQLELDREFRTKYNTFYAKNVKEVGRSASSGTGHKFQNNFLKSNGFQTLNKEMSRDEEKHSSRLNSNPNQRNYEKPWLINSNNREVLQATNSNWRKQSANNPAETKEPRKNPGGQDMIDFEQYKKEVNNRLSAKETSMSVKNNLESRETAENKSQETQKTNRRLLNYEVGQRLGKGSYATVHEAIDVNNNTRVAIKTYEKAKMNNKTRKTIIEREIQVLNMIDHPKMIKLHKVIQTKNHIHIVMELAEGQVLSQFYKSQISKRITEGEAALIFRQIIEAMAYCHRNGVYHRDIKTENVLIDKYKKIKIIDFGFSVKSSPSTKLTLFCGTPNYMSPEIILKREYLGAPSDTWALGVLLFVITAGYFPFKGKDDKELHKKIVNISLTYPPHASESLKNLINSILKFNPESRLTCDQILEHYWFREAR